MAKNLSWAGEVLCPNKGVFTAVVCLLWNERKRSQDLFERLQYVIPATQYAPTPFATRNEIGGSVDLFSPGVA
ncbi:hypothetical protein J6590_072706 [Homalodisca vitripennis]|nr:hypothetical protein J6590_072706 [Homalodisca vitripennis]